MFDSKPPIVVLGDFVMPEYRRHVAFGTTDAGRWSRGPRKASSWYTYRAIYHVRAFRPNSAQWFVGMAKTCFSFASRSLISMRLLINRRIGSDRATRVSTPQFGLTCSFAGFASVVTTAALQAMAETIISRYITDISRSRGLWWHSDAVEYDSL